MKFQKGHLQSNTGRTHFKKGMTPWNKGTTGLSYEITKEIREKLSHKGREHPNWKGGITQDKKKYTKMWQKNNPKKTTKTQFEYHQRLKLKVYQKISGLEKPQCVNCGCDDIRFLEINHINGGGVKERKEKRGSTTQFYRKILRNERKTEDLNILCRVCNALDHLKRKYGEVPIKVMWNK